MQLDGWGDGENLGGDKERETITGPYYMEKLFLIKKKKIPEETKIK